MAGVADRVGFRRASTKMKGFHVGFGTMSRPQGVAQTYLILLLLSLSAGWALLEAGRRMGTDHAGTASDLDRAQSNPQAAAPETNPAVNARHPLPTFAAPTYHRDGRGHRLRAALPKFDCLP